MFHWPALCLAIVWNGGNWISLITLIIKIGLLSFLGSNSVPLRRQNYIWSSSESSFTWLLWLGAYSSLTTPMLLFQSKPTTSGAWNFQCAAKILIWSLAAFCFSQKKKEKQNRWHMILHRITVYQVALHRSDNRCSRIQLPMLNKSDSVPKIGIYNVGMSNGIEI